VSQLPAQSGPVVVKLGGEALRAGDATDRLMRALVSLHRGERCGVVIVHGGGKALTEHLSSLGLYSQMVDGIRVTPREQIDHVVEVLAGKVNVSIVSMLHVLGQRALGLTAGQALMATAARAVHDSVDLGHVGTIQSGDASLVRMVLREGYLPVLSPIAFGEEGEALNINADAAAASVASILGACLLVLLTDVIGICDAGGDLLPELERARIDTLIDQGVISDGMIPKAHAALECAEHCGTATVISSWNDQSAVEALATGNPIGTRINAPKCAGVVT